MWGWLLAFQAAGAVVRPLRPSQWEPVKSHSSDVDQIGGPLVLFALILLVLILSAIVLALWGIVVVTSRMVIRTTSYGGR
jgi:hypothetical protein